MTPLDKAEGVRPPLGPDGRTWLEWSAEHHERMAAELRHSAKYTADSEAWANEIKQWTMEAEQHDCMATACREAMG